jgi:hypothetical protein
MQINVFWRQVIKLTTVSEPTEANMFAGHHITKRFVAAVTLAVIGSAPALAEPVWSPAAPIEYLQYDLTPYYELVMSSSPAFQYWRPNLAAESPYSGLYDYAPGAVGNASPMVEATPLPYVGYDLTPYYNLAPGCPSSTLSDDPTHICE